MTSERGRTFMSKTVESDESGTPDPAGADDLTSLRRRLLVPTLVLTASTGRL
jgi:hypothetical protein